MKEWLGGAPQHPKYLQAYKHGPLHPGYSLPRLGNTRLLQSAPAGPWPGNKLCQAWGAGGTKEHDSCYFLEATVGHNPDSCLAPHSTRQPLLGSSPQHGTPFPGVSTLSDPSQGHSLTVLVQAGRRCQMYLLVWAGENGGLCRVQQAGETAPPSLLLPACPPGCFPQPHTHQIPHMPVCL